MIKYDKCHPNWAVSSCSQHDFLVPWGCPQPAARAETCPAAAPKAEMHVAKNYAKLPHWIMYMAVYNRITENIMKHRQAMTLTSITRGIFIEPLQRSATLAPMLHQWFFAWAEVDGCWCLPAQNAGICDVLCIRQSKNLKQLWNMACFLDDEPLNMVILHSDILDYQRIAFGV